MEPTILDYAKRYIDKGWCVLPTFGNSKSPSPINWKEYQNRKATMDEWEQWATNPGITGICLITGAISGVVVVDLDEPSKAVDFNSTVISRTRSGGYHFFYKYSDKLKNSVRIDGSPIDFRGDGGLVVIPPSKAAGKDGTIGDYEWIIAPREENIANLPELPSNISKYLAEKTYEKVEPSKIIGSPTGNRNDSLYRYACSCCKQNSDSRMIAISQVRWMNSTFTPPLNERELMTIFDSAWNFIQSGNETYEMSAEKDMCPYKKFSEMSTEELRKQEVREFLQTGFKKLDDKFKWPAGFYLINGQPGAGKTWFALHMARQFYERNNKKTAYFSLELTLDEIKTRVLQSWSDLPYEAFLGGASTEKAEAILKRDPMVFYRFAQGDAEYEKPEYFRRDFQHFYDMGYRVFMFDHLMELTGANNMDTNHKIIEEWGKCFQEVSSEHRDCWIIVFAQPRKGAAKQGIMTMDDIRGSGSILQKVEFVLTLNNTQDKDENGNPLEDQPKYVIIHLDKNRVTPASYINERTELLDTGNFRLTEPIKWGEPSTNIMRDAQEIFEFEN